MRQNLSLPARELQVLCACGPRSRQSYTTLIISSVLKINCTKILKLIIYYTTIIRICVLILTEEFAADLGICLRWGNATTPCL
jgi:hypothetical protein